MCQINASEYIQISSVSLAKKYKLNENFIRGMISQEIIESKDYELIVSDDNLYSQITFKLDDNRNLSLMIKDTKGEARSKIERQLNIGDDYTLEAARAIRELVNPSNKSIVAISDYPKNYSKKKKVKRKKIKVIAKVSDNKKEILTKEEPTVIEKLVKKENKVEDKFKNKIENKAPTQWSLLFSIGLDLKTIQLNDGLDASEPPGSMAIEAGIYLPLSGHQLSYKTTFFNQSNELQKVYKRTSNELFYRYRVYSFNLNNKNPIKLDQGSRLDDIHFFPTVGIKSVTFSRLSLVNFSATSLYFGLETSFYSVARLGLGYDKLLSEAPLAYSSDGATSSLVLSISFGWGL